MTKNSRIALAVASLALLLVYVFPLWSITLEAPQYPEGIGMHIWIDTVTGVKANDLQNINGLNHYIGMKAITPDAIPELKIMPWVIGALMIFGLVAAAMGNRSMLVVWTGLFFVATIVGLVDFYLWEYDYGHNLDPTAAIKVPGMHYQPPFIGAKKLLNFTAHSWPALGGWTAFLSLGTGLVLAFLEGRKAMRCRRKSTPDSSGIRFASTAKQTVVVVPLLFFLAACMPEPRPLVHGHDYCAYCKMIIADERYGAEMVTTKGKIYTFDSVECLAAHQLESRVAPETIHSLWVVDFQDPPNLVEVREAFFLHSRDLSSPMGLNLTAFGPEISQQAVRHAFFGDILDWEGVQGLVRQHILEVTADSMQSLRHATPAQHSRP